MNIKKLAKIYAANVVANITAAGGAYSELLTDEENKELGQELLTISEKMTTHPLNFGELDQIIEYLTNPQK